MNPMIHNDKSEKIVFLFYAHQVALVKHLFFLVKIFKKCVETRNSIQDEKFPKFGNVAR